MHWSFESRLNGHCRDTYGEGLLTTSELCRRAGVTYRMLYMWAVNHLVVPAVPSQGSGTVRRWWPYQVGEVVEIRELKREQQRIGDLIAMKRRRPNVR